MLPAHHFYFLFGARFLRLFFLRPEPIRFFVNAALSVERRATRNGGLCVIHSVCCRRQIPKCSFEKIKQTHRRESLGQKQSATSQFNSMHCVSMLRFFLVDLETRERRRTSQSSRHQLFCLFALLLQTKFERLFCFEGENKNNSHRFVVVFISAHCLRLTWIAGRARADGYVCECASDGINIYDIAFVRIILMIM